MDLMDEWSHSSFLFVAQVEQEEVETMRGINKILLENILPAHVADRFLQNMNVKVWKSLILVFSIFLNYPFLLC